MFSFWWRGDDMRTSLPLILALALTLVSVAGADQPISTRSGFTDPLEGHAVPSIRSLQRSKNLPTAAEAPIRDPFFLPSSAPVVSETSNSDVAPAALAAKATAFQILGKQQDDEGWAIFISAPDSPGQVWVVRAGEAFNDNFRISKLAPPVLIIKNTRNHQSQTFNIGKDEDEN
jgi:hypothetical protein